MKPAISLKRVRTSDPPAKKVAQKSKLDHAGAVRYCGGVLVNALTVEAKGLVVVYGHAGGTCRA